MKVYTEHGVVHSFRHSFRDRLRAAGGDLMSLPNIQYWNNIFLPLEPLFTARSDESTPLNRDAASQAAMSGQN